MRIFLQRLPLLPLYVVSGAGVGALLWVLAFAAVPRGMAITGWLLTGAIVGLVYWWVDFGSHYLRARGGLAGAIRHWRSGTSDAP